MISTTITVTHPVLTGKLENTPAAHPKKLEFNIDKPDTDLKKIDFNISVSDNEIYDMNNQETVHLSDDLTDDD